MPYTKEWKVLSEDLTFIDLKANKVLRFATPFSMKSGTLALLQESIGKAPSEILLDEWVPIEGMQAEKECDSYFDLALYFGNARENHDFEISRLNPRTFVRCLIPCSNLIYIDEAQEKMLDYLSSAQCYEVKGGTLKERMSFIIEKASSSGASAK